MAATLQEVRKLVDELTERDRHALTSELIEHSGPESAPLSLEELAQRHDEVINGTADTIAADQVHQEARRIAGLD